MAQRVYFARINRRVQDGDPEVDHGPLRDDFLRLVDAQNTRADEHLRSWVVTDLAIDASGNFATGLLGMLDEEWRRQFDSDAWSLLKGERFSVGGGSERAISPFAVDLRPKRRWVGFAKAPRLQPSTFMYGLAAALNVGVQELGLWPRHWDVDPVTTPRNVYQWLKGNRDIRRFRRTVRRSNPGRDLNEDRQEMRELGAGTLQEVWTPPRSGRLRVLDADGEVTDTVRDKLRGLQSGDVDVVFVSRAAPGAPESRYNSRVRADETYIESFGDDFELGLERVRVAVEEYSDQRAAEDPGDLLAQDPDDLSAMAERENTDDA